MMHDNDDIDDEARLRDEREAAAVASLDAQLTELAMQSAAGEQVDAPLAQLLETLSDAARTEVVQRFRTLQEELARLPEASQELTPEMETQQRLLEERERRMMISQWLSEQTLKKIRRAFLLNPAIFQHIVSIGEELNKKGVFFETRKAQVTNAQLGGVSLQADLAQNKDKEKDSGRGL